MSCALRPAVLAVLALLFGFTLSTVAQDTPPDPAKTPAMMKDVADAKAEATKGAADASKDAMKK